MINLEALKNLTEEQLASMTKDQTLLMDARIALLSIQLDTSFLDIAAENCLLTRDDAYMLITVQRILKETLQKVYPNRPWK